MNMNLNKSQEHNIRGMTKEEQKQHIAQDIEEAVGCLTMTIKKITDACSFMIVRTDIYFLYRTDKELMPIEPLGKFINATEVTDAIFTYIDEKEKESKSDEYEYEQN